MSKQSPMELYTDAIYCILNNNSSDWLLLIQQKNSRRRLKLSLSRNHYRQITYESPSGGFINCKSKAVWKIAKSLYIYSMCVCVWVRGLWAHCDAVLDGCPHSDVPIDSLAYMAENRPVFHCRSIQTQCWGDSPRLTHKHTSTHRCLHLNTYEHGNTIVCPLQAVSTFLESPTVLGEEIISPRACVVPC